MIRVSGSIEIARSVGDVFDFVSDPGNMPLWQIKSVVEGGRRA